MTTSIVSVDSVTSKLQVGGVDSFSFTANGITYTPSGTGTVTSNIQEKLREISSLKDFNAVGDGSTDDTIAVQAAFTWLAGSSYRKLVGVQGKNYKLTSSVTVGGTYAQFDGQGCGFKYAFSATPANPMFAITSATWFALGNFTQQVDVASGKGHVLSLIGNGTSPSYINLHDIGINSAVGSGKNNSGSSMNACGVYAYGIANLNIDNVFIQDSTNGFYFDTCDKLTTTRSVADDCTNQGIYMNACVNVDIGGGSIINGCGATGQGAMEFVAASGLFFHNSRIKGGAGSQILSTGGAATQRRVTIRDNHMEVYSNTDDAIKLRTNCVAAIVEGNDIQVVPNGTNNYTAMINIVDTPGVVGYGGRIIGNNIRLGGATTLVDGIKLSSSTNPTRGWVIESNTIGSIASSDVGGVSTITNAINLSGTGSDNKVRSNIISGASTQTITNGIIISSSQTNAELDGNRFDGTVTNRYVDSGIQTISDRTGSFTPVVFGSTTVTTAAGAFTIGVTYQIAAVGSTNFVAIGAASNTVGVFFVATGVGSGTGTAYSCGTYTTAVGRYVRTGKLVHITINLVWTAHVGTGDLRITGFPNNLISTTNDQPVGTCLADSLTFAGQLVVYGNAGASYVRLASIATGAALTFVQIDTAATLLLTMMYEVA